MSDDEVGAGRRDVARGLAEEVLADIELSRSGATEVARKAYRLARMVEDFDAMEWLRFEVAGFPRASGLPAEAWRAAVRSGRVSADEDGTESARVESLGAMEARVRGGHEQIAAAADAPVSVSSANPSQFVRVPDGNARERSTVHVQLVESQGFLDRIVGAIHVWVSEIQYELRFGRAVEDAFEVVRAEVDRRLGQALPDAVARVSAAFENASSDNPEQWANAAAGCRRLIKAAADQLRPVGPPVNGRQMGDENYINRLVDWIVTRSTSDTLRDVVTSELEYLGRRLDSLTGAGNKGAHTDVGRFEASRYVTGTYLVLGDILRLDSEAEPPVFVDQSGIGGSTD